MVEKPDVMSGILYQLNKLDPIREPKDCDIMLIFAISVVSQNPCSYYNNNYKRSSYQFLVEIAKLM